MLPARFEPIQTTALGRPGVPARIVTVIGVSLNETSPHSPSLYLHHWRRPELVDDGREMIAFLGKRLLVAVPTVLLVTLIVFVLVDLSPNDPIATLAGDNPSPERVAELRTALGLDQPLWARYLDWGAAALRGDLGTSPITYQPVFDELLRSAPITISLVFLATVISLVLGLALGVLAALQRDGFFDWVVGVVSNLLQTIPPFIAALVLVLFFAIQLPLLPATGYVPLTAGVGEWLTFMIMPALALSLIPAALIMRQTRGALIDALEADYVRTAYAKGLRMGVVVAKHAAKNAAVPVVTVLGLVFLAMTGSSVIIENIFAIPGLGALSVNAVLTGDLVMIQGVVVFFALLVTVVNLLVDMSYGYFNPKLRKP